MRFLPINLTAMLVELADLDETLSLFTSLEQRPITGIKEIIPAARTLLIHYYAAETDAKKLATEIRARDLSSGHQQLDHQVMIPVHYCSEDLTDVADYLGITSQALIARHTDHEYRVAFTGFAPGFAYLTSGSAGLNVPRRKTPRTRIPAGSVALAGEFSGIYPQASPGGWQLIGQTDLAMWDLAREQPALLKPGYRVSFVDADKSPQTISLPTATAKPVTKNDQPNNGMRVLTTGLQTLFQDLGRAGQAAIGISESGAMDKKALYSANRLVGNEIDTACLEITQGGFSAQSDSELIIAITGAPCDIRLITQDQQEYRLATYQPIHLIAGDKIKLGPTTAGVRSYLAVRGGFALFEVLGSCSFDTLANVGPAPLKIGDRLSINKTSKLSTLSLHEIPAITYPTAAETVVLDVILGPRTDWFTEQAIELLANQSWQVTAASNRIGLRLIGEQALTRSQLQELPSEGTCVGAIQIPADGQPVLFLNDHPLTGGYPVIGTVAEYHLDLAGQIPVNAKIRFNPIRLFEEIARSDAADE